MDHNKNAFYSLKVKEIVRETSLAVSIYLDIPQDLKDLFQYIAGQYITINVTIDGEEQRRAYSLSSSPVEDRYGFTAKEVENGTVSKYLNQTLKVGDTMEVMPPQGRFYTKADSANNKTYYFFAAGSGITPVMSMMKAILDIEGASTVHLLYGNKTKSSTIFLDELTSIQEKHSGAFTFDLSYTAEEIIKPKFKLWGKKEVTFSGRINKKQVEVFLKEHKSFSKTNEYFICGPNEMIDAVENTLKGSNINKKNIHLERFTPKTEDEDNKADIKSTDAKMVVTLEGETIILDIQKGKTIMQTLIDAGHEAPYSCKTGTCSTCMAKLTKGTAEMEVCFALDDDEVEEGLILTCQAKCTSSEVELNFDID